MAKVLSIEIGANVTRICLTDYRVKNPKVYKYTKIATPAGVFMDGQIQVTEEFVRVLRNTIAENKMNCRRVVFPLTSSRVASREMDVPLLSEKKIKSMVRVNAPDYFPLDLSQYEIGYCILGKDTVNHMCRIQVLAVPLNLLERYEQLAAACGMRMVAADYSGNGIYQMVKGACTEGIKMVVKVDDQASIVTIIKNESVVLQRTVTYGVHMASEEAASLLNVDGGVVSSIKMLVNGLARIVDYYSIRNNGEVIEQILITGFIDGMKADFSGLCQLITNELGIKTEELTHLEGQTLERSFADDKFGEYIACVGAAIAPVGFFSEKRKNGKSGAGENDLKGMAYLLLISGILIAMLLLTVSLLGYRQQQERYDRNVARLNELSEIRTIYAAYSSVKTVYDEVEKMYAETENHNEDLLNFLAEMEKKMPAEIQVKTFSASLDNVTMNIVVGTKEEMANAVQELRNFDSVETVTVLGVQDKVEEEGMRTVSFTVSCSYKAIGQRTTEVNE